MSLKNLQSFNFYLDIIGLVYSLLLCSIILFKLRFRLDRTAYLIIGTYLASMVLRVVTNSLKSPSPVVLILWPISSSAITGILFNFVFEMKIVQQKLTFTNTEEQLRQEIKINKIRVVTLLFFILYMIEGISVYYLIAQHG